MYLIGVTGGIATGKSLISSSLIERGYTLIDGDIVARQVVEPGQLALEKLVKIFGSDILKDGHLDRERLGNIIFNSPEKRQQVNRIIHPEIYKVMKRKIFASLWRREKYVFLDLPLLYESGAMVKFLSKVIVVSCNQELQLKRLMERNSMSEKDAKARISSQMPLEEKCRRADFVINNNGNREETLKQLDQVLNELKENTYPSLRYFLLDLLLFCTSFATIWLFCSFLEYFLK